MAKHIYITAQDKKRLTGLVYALLGQDDQRELPHIRQLAKEVEDATVITDPAQTPSDVVTMRSRVRLKPSGSGDPIEVTLVYPSEGDPENGQISVLAPLGTAMLGCKEGDSFDVDLPKGRSQYKVEEMLYQPESAGDHHL